MHLLVLPCWLAAFLVLRRTYPDWREAALAASTFWGALIVALTEGLSLFHTLAFIPLLVAWILISCLSAAVCVAFWPEDRAHDFAMKNVLRQIQVQDTPLVLGVGAILLVTFAVAVIAPPNTWDSMTYHMARVTNWIDH